MIRLNKRPQHRTFGDTDAAAGVDAGGALLPGPGSSRVDPWQGLGFPDLANTMRRICTLSGWTQAPSGAGRTLAVTSALEREGKSSIARAVAITMAQDHASEVLLLECDLLRPSVGQDGGVAGGPGLSEVLSGDAELAAALRPTELPNLALLPAGSLHGHPSRLLRSPAMQGVLDELRTRFAFIVLDLPAVLKSSDATVLARLVDGTVLVVRGDGTDERAVQQAIHLLGDANLLGIVLNRWHSSVPDVVRRLLQF